VFEHAEVGRGPVGDHLARCDHGGGQGPVEEHLLIIKLAATYSPEKAVGLDAALTTLAARPYGAALLLLAAAGLACYGIYCLFDARYRRG
jgi:hypothetical protein